MSQQEICERLAFCEFFISEIKIESIANRYKEKYCYSCKDACAIYMIFQSKGNDHIPANLYPNEYDKALKIIAQV